VAAENIWNFYGFISSTLYFSKNYLGPRIELDPQQLIYAGTGQMKEVLYLGMAYLS